MTSGSHQSTSSAARSASTPSPTPSAQVQVSPTPPMATGMLPVTRLGFSCRLPVSSFAGSGTTAHQQGGFIKFPGADYADDPNGNGGLAYDAAFSTWLPVPRANVAPDGTRYVLGYDGDPGRIRFVDVRTGKTTDVSVPRPAPAPAVWAPIDFAADGVYLLQGWESVASGIWRLSPDTGALSRVADVKFWASLHGTGSVFWTVVFDQADTGPRVEPLGYGNEVLRVDAATGSSEKWLYEPGYALSVAAVDQHGSLIVLAQDSTHAWRVLKVTGAGEALTVYSGTTTVSYQQAVADAHGFWFTASDGVYFLSDSTGFVRVSDKQASPAGSCS